LNTLFGSAKDDPAKLLKRHGYQILGKNQRELVEMTIEGRAQLGELVADFTVAKKGKRYAVCGVRSEGESDPTLPALRDRLIAFDRAFGLNGVILADWQNERLQTIALRYPRERGLEFYFQFLAALFVLAFVIGIIWLMVAVKLF